MGRRAELGGQQMVPVETPRGQESQSWRGRVCWLPAGDVMAKSNPENWPAGSYTPTICGVSYHKPNISPDWQ